VGALLGARRDPAIADNVVIKGPPPACTMPRQEEHMPRSAPRSRALLTALVLATGGILIAVAPATAAPPPAAGPRAAAVTIDDPAQYVNTFVGTKPGADDFGHGGGAGNTFPGADAPFGMLQWSPDTQTYQHGGYSYGDNRIRGFSLTHLSGAGCGDFGNIPFLPTLGTSLVPYYTFRHANEAAAPGSYAVTFDNGLRTELAVTQRAGVARFSYPGTQTASLLVDVAKAFNNALGSFTVGPNSITGYTDGGGFCGAGNRYRIHFTATFDHPITGTSRPTPTQALLHFDTSASRVVTARVGISFVSLAGARANVDAEIGTRGLEAVRDGARAAWNALLGRIAVGGGTTDQRRVLYTGLYHSLLHPNVFSDVNGEYRGFDGQLRTVPAGRAQYANFSGWDVYRSQVQLVALIAAKEASDIAQSAVNQAVQGGYWDRWTVANDGTGVMVGDPMAIIASAIHAFGGTDFDAAEALRRAVNGSRDGRQRPGYAEYDAKGYLPAGQPGIWGSVSTTLEYTSADFAVAALAGRLGDTATERRFLRRAQNWRNLFNPARATIQPRNADATWPAYSPTQENEYVEGNGAQYSWMVPYNHRGLFDAIGGNAAAVSRLDTFFTKLNAGSKEPYAYLGNEPSLNTPWAYSYAGAPYKTHDVVRRALTTLFKPLPEGLVGNDDLGEMSSWAVWAALGMYPQAPGRAELVLASPLFPAVTIRRGNGAVLDLTAPGASAENRYVQSLRVNGATSTRPWLTESFVRTGGTLDFTLGATPNTGWGSAPGDAPPSFDAPGGALPSHFDNVGTSDDANRAAADYDLVGYSYSAQALAAAGVRPGGTVTAGGLTFTWPSAGAGAPNNVIAAGQTVDVTAAAGAARLSLLGSGTHGNPSGTLTVTYTDGTSQTATIGLSDWTLNGGSGQPAFGNVTAATSAYRNRTSGGTDQVRTYVFATAPVTLTAGKQVRSVRLPATVSTGRMHVFAIAIA
jgi:predicted alpha-1,2-mannosidase